MTDTELADRFARAAVARLPTEVARWLDPDVALDELRQVLTAAVAKQRDDAYIARFRARCPVEGASDDDYRGAEVAVDGRAVLLEPRFKGLDPDRSFIEVVGHEGPADASLLRGVMALASERWSVFKPRALRATLWPSAPEGIAAEPDLEVVAGTTTAICRRVAPEAARAPELVPITDTSGFERFTNAYRRFVDGHPVLRDELWIPDKATFANVVQHGHSYDVVVEGAWAGLIAAVPAPFMGANGWMIHEELLDEAVRGRRLAAPMQRALIERLHADRPGVVHGTIHHRNAASIATARRVGRDVVGRHVFLPLGDAA